MSEDGWSEDGCRGGVCAVVSASVEEEVEGTE